MEQEKTMYEIREDFLELLNELGFNETINDELNDKIENCGIEFGKYGNMRKLYLEETDWDKYYKMVMNNSFIEHFQNVDKRANELFSKLYNDYLKKYKNEAVAINALEEFIIKEVVEV